jgi:sigma-54 dependent transcriptional regulator, acetoin dehydrogenase operon transcriptional activator AcoR
VPAPVHVSATPDSRLAKAREKFLTADRVAPGEVREPILASWWRSRDWKIAADRVSLAYVRHPNLETPLARSALPVLNKLRQHLDGQKVSIILTDPAGVVLVRLTADHDLERHLDGVYLAPGFSYAEDYVGTNGIGTALEGGGPAHVFGHEHYAEDLEDLACAGVPIHDPVSGKTVGAVDLTCWRRDADPLLIALSKSTADQISRALLSGSSAREFQLLQEYLRACRHTTGIVLALSHDMVMMNDTARQVLDSGDQTALLGQAAEALDRRRGDAVEAELPSGVHARMYCRPVAGDGSGVGGVVHVKLIEPSGRTAQTEPGARTRMYLPGLVGSGPLWVRGCRQVEAVRDSGEWLALDGEPGAGKLAVLRAVHQRSDPASGFHVLDAAEAGGQEWQLRVRRELLDGTGTLVIRHVDTLAARQARALAHTLEEISAAQEIGAAQETGAAGRPEPPWVAVTYNQQRASDKLARVLRFFPRTVEVPPLRHHIEDLNDLVPFFLAKLGLNGRLSVSQEAMQLLLRMSWPGNIEQLWQVLRRVAQRRRSGSVQPADLPPECWTVSRRRLTPLEAMERDAIVQSLLDCDGNKVKAAGSLGMSRATIYRKIHEYGIVTPLT